MNLNELQIGDWCHCRDNTFKVTIISNGYVGFSLSGNRTQFCGKSKIRPVILTTDLLEKNGFIKVNKQRYDLTGEGYFVNINPKKGYIYVNGSKNHCNMYDAYTVHGLQNALRICGLSELADNFKV